MASALLTSVDATNHIHLIVGANPLAGARCTKSLEVGARPKLVAPNGSEVHFSVSKRAEAGEVQCIVRPFDDADLTTLGRPEVDGVVDAVFITLSPRDPLSTRISNLCRRLRIPVNVADSHSLSTFTLLSTYSDGPLQIGVTTSGKGCKMASRIRREIASLLPPNLGTAVSRLGALRRRFWEEDNRMAHLLADDYEGEDEDLDQPSNFNQLIRPEDLEAARDRRMRWLSQICEYWPLKRLCTINEDDVNSILASYTSSASNSSASLEPTPGQLDNRLASKRRGAIILAGSGPGAPSLLTTATLTAIQTADLILADKLVPEPVLDLVPRRTPVRIARKFPGNAEAAQDELLALGLEGLEAGKTVLRLKQGDPYLFGRGGEEVLWFRERGWHPIVLPGLTSALSAPLFAGIPVTQRAVADQVLICTGTGRAGKAPPPPEYVPSRTVVFLMALHRLASLVASLTGADVPVATTPSGKAVEPPPRITDAWPVDTPCAIVERASCRDQRVVRSTLRHVVSAVEELGSRPPGLLVVGRACAVLAEEKGRGGERWSVEEGYADLEGLERITPEILDA